MISLQGSGEFNYKFSTNFPRLYMYTYVFRYELLVREYLFSNVFSAQKDYLKWK